jgi:cell division GTPase FtsZ
MFDIHDIRRMAMIEPVLEQTRGPRIVVAGIGGAGGNAVTT